MNDANVFARALGPDLVHAYGAVPSWRSDRQRFTAERWLSGADATDTLQIVVSHRTEAFAQEHGPRASALVGEILDVSTAIAGSDVPSNMALAAYLQDAFERWVLTLDVLRQRGDTFLQHEADGCPPVLAYDYEIILDGASLERPCNYQLLRIAPPAGTAILDKKRPYVIIDPRAGHGPGIGGFKPESQVGVALKAGHPVYFVSFRREPEPRQTVAAVADAHAAFMREVGRRHPDSPRPVVAGNCQGGWAALVAAATNCDLTGPLVLNGAPVATWSGKVGTNPMRYNAGVLGGTWQAMLPSDLGAGAFDGANLVMNFEQLDPARSNFRKYYDLFADPEQGRRRFLDFERWWGGFFLQAEAEIRWIVGELFVGNKLTKNRAELEPGKPIDLKQIQAPIIIFTSHGDNITPPQQALNWIVDTYASVDEIRARGQRLVYMVHEDTGHLGIFVSSKVAQQEHTEIASTLKTIETLAPGLYEMVMEDAQGNGDEKRFTVSFAARTFGDIRAFDDGREDEAAFAAVARASEIQSEFYDVAVRPLVQLAVPEPVGALGRAVHPMRLQRSILASTNPAMTAIEAGARTLERNRRAIDPNNPYRRAEAVLADLTEQWMDVARDVRDAAYEVTFFTVWGNPWAKAFGVPNAVRRRPMTSAELRKVPAVENALLHIRTGGLVEAVIRALILLADSAGQVGRGRLETATKMLTEDQPFASLSMDERMRIINEQTLIVTFGGDEAVDALSTLLSVDADARRTLNIIDRVLGRDGGSTVQSRAMLERLRATLGPAAGDSESVESTDGEASSSQVFPVSAE